MSSTGSSGFVCRSRSAIASPLTPGISTSRTAASTSPPSTAAGAVAVQDRAVQRALGALQPSDRAVQAVWSGVPAQSSLSYRQLDRLARDALEPVLHQPAFAVEVFRQATWGGAFVNLGAVD